MFEGLIQMQLPFILISSGISSGLYLLFLFFNIGQPTVQSNHNIEKEAFTIEISKDNLNQDRDFITLYDYSIQSVVSAADLVEPIDPSQIEEFRPIKFRSFRFAYSFHFAEASFGRPPPFC